MTRYMLYPYYVAHKRPRADWEAKFLVGIARGLFAAPTYQVTADMCDVAEQMYEQTARANGHIEAADLPSETGFLWLDKPFLRTDPADGQLYQTRAVAWQPQALRYEGEEPRDGVRITLWADWKNDPRLTADRVVEYADELRQAGPLQIVMTMVLPFGQDFGGITDEYTAPTPLHHVHAVWLLLGTEVAAACRGEVHRSTRHRVAGSIRHDQVTVITLRRGLREATEHGDREVDWSCRWIVRGFWRHQWGHGTIGRPHTGQPGPDGLCMACGARITWVRPYVKGPDDRPLKATQTLYRLRR